MKIPAHIKKKLMSCEPIPLLPSTKHLIKQMNAWITLVEKAHKRTSKSKLVFKCKHDRPWILAAGAVVWCDKCGAWRKAGAWQDGCPKLTGRWIRPRGNHG